jgi:choline-glycine betaine transporter
MKIFIISLITAISIYAREANEQELHSIYNEAILFVAVFTLMSVISFIVSKRQAKKYMQHKDLEKDDESDSVEVQKRSEAQIRVEELEKMCRDGLLTQAEFEVLKEFKLSA